MTVTIPNEVTEYIQKLFYEWQGCLKLIEYLTAQGSNAEYLKYYTDLALSKNTELEIAKETTVNTYVNIDEPFDYSFDFNNSAIICTLK